MDCFCWATEPIKSCKQLEASRSISSCRPWNTAARLCFDCSWLLIHEVGHAFGGKTYKLLQGFCSMHYQGLWNSSQQQKTVGFQSHRSRRWYRVPPSFGMYAQGSGNLGTLSPMSPTCLPACLPACLPLCLSLCLPACLPLCLSLCLLACPSLCLPLFLQLWFFGTLEPCLPRCLPPCLPSCLPSRHPLWLLRVSNVVSHGVFHTCLPPCLSLCLPLCLPLCLARLVSHFVSHLISAFTCLTLCLPACLPLWLCLPLCLPLHFVFRLVSQLCLHGAGSLEPWNLVSQLSRRCLHLSSKCGFPDVFSQQPPDAVFHLAPTTPSCLPHVVSHLSQRCECTDERHRVVPDET